ncbi:galactose oxidase early set domain-containing protein [Kitasatospora azatica]|uniref:galactose oxidase early set domain-containing protein n=1 Tax=Kitasatospora azatica TaxID=58347 RepID=UPI00056B08CA|nr:galactose oxidase early set domain-containing protein [Kitasatospora azatica]
MSRRRLSAAFAAGAATLALTTAAVLTTPLSQAPAFAADQPGGWGALRITPEQLNTELRPDEVATFGQAAAESMARDRIGLRAVGEYPDPIRTMRFKSLTDSQAALNAKFPDTAKYGRFTDYFKSPDFGDHVALLPTGKVLLFSFERIETNPQKEPAPTQTIGRENAGRAYLWDPSLGTGPDAFKSVPPPTVNLDDGKNEPRPAPLFCAGHSYLPNGMVGVFGGNFGGNNGAGARFSMVFDPYNEKWLQQQDMAVGRWYPSVVTGADGRQLIMSGQTELGWGMPTPLIERFPVSKADVPYSRTFTENNPVYQWQKADAPYRMDYPHLFSLNDGKVYGFGRDADQQFLFDPNQETRSPLPNRPDGGLRMYGSAVALPNGAAGPNSVLILGGNHNDKNTYKFSGGRWTTDTPRAFGRAQDDTLILPNGQLFTVNGAYGIRDYGFGDYNPNADLKYRQTELRDANGSWTLGPAQRLPRGYHSNAVLLPDGRIMVTGDELQQLASNPDINNPNANGTIEIYEPPYLFQGPRPELSKVPDGPIGFNQYFPVGTTTTGISKAVLVAPITSTHSVDTSQRYIELPIANTGRNQLLLKSPATPEAATPGYYMLFLLNDKGVPSMAKWVQLDPNA